MEYSLVTVAETRTFRRKAEKLLSEMQVLELVVYLSANPMAGVLIKGAMPLYLLDVFGKNEKTDLTGAEKKNLKNLVSELVELEVRANE